MSPPQQGEFNRNRAPLGKPKDVNFLGRPPTVVDQVVKYLGQKVERGRWVRVWEEVA